MSRGMANIAFKTFVVVAILTHFWMAEQSASILRRQLQTQAELVALVRGQGAALDDLKDAAIRNAIEIQKLDESQLKQVEVQTLAAQALAVQLLRLEATVDKVGVDSQQRTNQGGGAQQQEQASAARSRHAELRVDVSRVEDSVDAVLEKLRLVEMVVNGESATLGIRSVFQRQSVILAAHRYQSMQHTVNNNEDTHSSRDESAGQQRKQRQRAAQHPRQDEVRSPVSTPVPPQQQQQHKSKFMEAVEHEQEQVPKGGGGGRRKLRSIGSAGGGTVQTITTAQPVELQVMIPTFKRLYSTDPHEYLRKVLKSIAAQHSSYSKQNPGRPLLVVVVNTGPTEHFGVKESIEEAVGGSGLTVKYEEVNNQFTDPYPKDYHVKVDYDKRKDILESWAPSRKHTMHLAEVLLKAQQVDSKYTLLVEDDMVWCSSSSSSSSSKGKDVDRSEGNALSKIFAAIDHANAVAPDWTGVRVGYGGNGLVLPSSDASALADYLLANMHRRPPDWLLTEWYKGGTFTSKSSLGDRHSGFTFRYNLFEHIGEHSAFPGREKQASKRNAASDTNKAEQVEFNIPQCFEYNWYLLPEERFDPRCKAARFTPCVALVPL